MTSSFTQLVNDFKVGKNEGEDVLQAFLLEKYGIITENIGTQKLGWDLEVRGVDASKLGLSQETFKEDYFLDKFIKQFGSKFEVKRDSTSDKTGNLYWECWSNIRTLNSGCMLTCTADTIVFVRKVEFIFLSRKIFLSWMFDNLFMRTEISDLLRDKTFKGGKKQMMSAKNNSDVRGILLPVEVIKKSPACILIEKRP
jgi:hypothetical protein